MPQNLCLTYTRMLPNPWPAAWLFAMGSIVLGQPCQPTQKQLARSAGRGSAAAQYDLGERYASGVCIQRDDAQAVAWYLKSAAQGYAPAEFRLGYFYTEGREVPQDFPQAVQWLEKAAGQGHAESQYALGTMYATGRGVAKDLVSAYRWIRISAPASDEHAAAVLATLAKSMSSAEIERAEAQAKTFHEDHSRPKSNK
jgi:TPR repeat protein